jgi:hypothetical protein
MDLNFVVIGIYIGILGLIFLYLINKSNKALKNDQKTIRFPKRLEDPYVEEWWSDGKIKGHNRDNAVERSKETIVFIKENGEIIDYEEFFNKNLQTNYYTRISTKEEERCGYGNTSEEAEFFAHLDYCWNNLPKGKLVYNPPPEMKLGTRERIEVRIARDLTKDLTKGLKSRGKPQEEEIKVGPKMTVHLEGNDAFNIKKLFANESRAMVGDYTQWEWDVTPLKTGIQKLMLFINAKIELPKYQTNWIDFPVLEREIRIQVDYSYKIKNFLEVQWQWIIGTIIALSGAIIAFFGLWKP